MPAPLFYAHKILRLISEDRHAGKLPLLGPDAKSQVTLEYVNGQPTRAARIVVSTQHDEKIDQADVRELVRPYVKAALPENWMCEEENFYVNPTGRFVIGGPDGDAGLTGRKIIVDTYGGAAPYGRRFRGKNPDKGLIVGGLYGVVSGKKHCRAGIADCFTIQLAYAIGVSGPCGGLCCTPRWRGSCGRRETATNPARVGETVAGVASVQHSELATGPTRRSLVLRAFRARN